MEKEELEEACKIIGRTIKSFCICGTTLDISFTDNTKVYNLLNHPRWVQTDEQGYPTNKEVQFKAEEEENKVR